MYEIDEMDGHLTTLELLQYLSIDQFEGHPEKGFPLPEATPTHYPSPSTSRYRAEQP